MAEREPLGVWLEDRRVAEFTSRRPGEVRCRYTDEALDRWPGNIPLLSCSLPLRTGWQDASVFAAGLLPEGEHRSVMAALAGVASFDTFGMLERFGRDVAGALVIGRASPSERPGAAEPYTPEGLAREVDALGDQPLALHDDSELSLAGLQDKMLLVAMPDGGWARPVQGLPSTHILKVEDRRFPGMAEAEAACLRLARAVGLTTVDAWAEAIGELPCLIVSRFDRVPGSDGTTRRVHQEDACQALARDPEAGRRRGKYEAAGGPAFREVAGLLERYALDIEAQLRKLAAAAVFVVCTGNADAHGKNIALLHPTVEHVELAPLYDTVPTVLWPRLRSTGAMRIGGVADLDDVTVADILAEASSWRLPRPQAQAAAVETAEGLLAAAAESRMPERLADLVTARAKRLLASG